MRSHTRMFGAVAIALAVSAVSTRAQQPASTSAIDANAVLALNAMAAYLRSLTSFEVESVTTTDEVMDDGQTLQYAGTVSFLVQMPNRLVADAVSDRSERTYVYDGKTFTLFSHRIGYYATVPAPPSLRELDDVLIDSYDIQLPLMDLFRFGSPRWSLADLRAAKDIGPSAVGGTTCERYAFRQDGIDWQIWIQKGPHPLPRKLVITTTSVAARPQHSAVYIWNLAPSFDDEAFTFVPPAGAARIMIATGSPQ